MGTDDLLDDHKTVIQVGKFTNVDLRAIPVGESVSDIDMLLDLVVFDGNKSTGDFVNVHYSTDGSHCGGVITDGVTVARTSATQWTITAATGSVACMTTTHLIYELHDFGELVLTVDEL